MQSDTKSRPLPADDFHYFTLSNIHSCYVTGAFGRQFRASCHATERGGLSLVDRNGPSLWLTRI